MNRDGTFNFNDPADAAAVASEICGDVLNEIGPSILQMPLASRIMFFEAFLARFYGAMNAVLGDEMAKCAREHVAHALERIKEQPGSVLH